MAGTDSLRSAVHRLAIPARRTAEILDPSLLLARHRLRGLPVVGAVVCVYRRRHVAGLARRLASLPPEWQIALWALESVAPELADWTAGAGPGVRFGLVNRITAGLSLDEETTLVILDDDIDFVRGSVLDAVGLARLAGLDVAQPAHVASSDMSYPFVRTRPGVAVRRTTYVEQGPCLLLSAQARRALLPLPEDIGMGWGIEADWSRRAAAGSLSMGIIDAVTLRHLAAPGSGYDLEAQWAQAVRLFAAAGFDPPDAAHRTTARLRAWHLPQAGAQHGGPGGR